MKRQKPVITRTTHTLPFERLSWQDFERLSLALLLREDFDNPSHYGVVGGEHGRDIIAQRNGDIWYVQCKRRAQCGPQELLQEIHTIARFVEEDTLTRPVGILFMLSCNVSAQARDRVQARCAELGLACEIWGLTDMDARVQQYPDIVTEFFGLEQALPLDPFGALGVVDPGEPSPDDRLTGEEEVWLQAFAFRTPEDLDREIAHTQQLLHISQLRWAKGQVPKSGGESSDMALELEAEQVRIQEYKTRLTELNHALRVAEKVRVPTRMLIKDFLDGNLYGAVLDLFMSQLRGDFDDRAVVCRMTEESPEFRRRVAARLLGTADEDDDALAQAIHRSVHGLVSRPDSNYIRLPGDKYRRVHYWS